MTPTHIRSEPPHGLLATAYGTGVNSTGVKEFLEYTQSANPPEPGIFDVNGVDLPICEYDEGDSWSVADKNGFPLVIGLVTAPAGCIFQIVYSISTIDEISFISSHVPDVCLTSTVGPPCEGIFRNDFGVDPSSPIPFPL